MESLLQDLRVAARTLMLRPGFTIAAALTIALGIGATTSVFSVVYSIVLRPLPYPESNRLVAIWPTDKAEPNLREVAPSSAVNVRDWKRDAGSFESMTTFNPSNLTLQVDNEPQVVAGARVSTDFFRVFGVPLTLGREFTTQETTFGGPQAVVLSHGLWREQFGGRPDILGRSIEISGVQRTVVGVAAAGFDFPNQARLWIDDENDDNSCGRGCVNVGVIGRLRAGVTLAAARAELRRIADRMEQAYPAALTGVTVVAATLQETIVGDARQPLFILFGAIAMVLLIACANMANLLLVRGSARASEMAVRATLGASRFRLIRQLLTESALLAAIGALAGVLLANWVLEVLRLLSPGNLPRLAEVTVGLPGWLFALALVGFTTFAFGLAPSLRLTRTTLAESMRHGGRGDTGPGSTLGRSLLLAGEVAFAVVLLLGAGLLLRSFLEIQRIELGFQPERITQFSVSMPATRFSPEQRIQLVEQLRNRLSARPGVESVAYMTAPPLGPVYYFSGVQPTDRPPAKPGEGLAAMARLLDPHVISTLGIQLVSGRNLDDRDRRGAIPVMLINRRAAEQFWPGQNPIGKQVDIGIWFGFEETGPRTIVGVVDNIKAQTLTSAPTAEIYLPWAQTASSGVTFLIKSRADSENLLSAARAELRRLDPTLPVIRPGVLLDDVARALAAPRFYSTSLTAFAAIAILLATIGIYGVVAYLVTQRKREIGVRLALGADIRDVIRLILWQGLRPALIGLSAGLIAAVAASRVLQTLLYEVERTDPITFALTPLLVITLVAIACIIPARRASQTSPAIALRSDQA